MNSDKHPEHIVSIYCLAHKLQLASRSAIVPLKSDNNKTEDLPIVYFSAMEKFTQSAYIWFKMSGKKIGVFRDVSEFPTIEMLHLHLERWISSQYNTVKNFILSWKTAVDALRRIIEDPSFDKKTSKEAEELLFQFTDKKALITLHFLWDYTSVLKIWSEYLQKLSGVIIDQKQYFDHLKENLRKLETFDGKVMTSFLKECTCASDPCTLESYENSSSILWKGIVFQGYTDSEFPKFSDAAKALIRKTNERLRHYLPLDPIDAANVLNPKSLPPGVLAKQYQNPNYGDKDIRYLATMLGFDADVVLHAWKTLLDAIHKSDSWPTNRVVMDANTFWALCLRDTTLPWIYEIRRFIQSIKTLSPSSVACETGFSIFNVIKTKTRSRLSDANVNAIMTILINGPGSVDRFDSQRYGFQWILTGHRWPKEDDQSTDESCSTEPQNNMDIASDAPYDEPITKMFPEKDLSPPYIDAYMELAASKEFTDNTKEKRSKSRFRSSIM